MQSDHLGTERMRTDINGTPCQTTTNLPFGDNATTPLSNCAPSTLFFTGDERDSETGLDHTLFRKYSSTQGRWMSPDPYLGSMDLANPQSFNRYAYVMGGPINFYDPFGLYCSAQQGEGDTPCNPANSGGGGSGQGLGFDDFQLQSIPVAYQTYGWYMTGSATQNSDGTWNLTAVPTFGQINTVIGNAFQLGSISFINTSAPTWEDNSDVAIDNDIFHNSPKCPNCGTIFNSAATWGNSAFVGTGVILAGVPAIGAIGASSAGESLIGEFTFNPATNSARAGLLNRAGLLRSGWGYVQYGIVPTLATGQQAGMYVLRLSSGGSNWPWWLHFPYPF